MDERIILNTDGKIDLTIPKDFEEYDNTIDIYLHGTDELVGMIWFEDFSDDEFTKYYGNVGYVIKEKFRRKGYAFSALKLLKKSCLIMILIKWYLVYFQIILLLVKRWKN